MRQRATWREVTSIPDLVLGICDGTYPVEIRLGNNVIAKSAVQVIALK